MPVIFPETQLATYLGFFIPAGQVEPLLDRIAEVSSEMEEMDLVSFLHLAQQELELTGDMNRDDAAVVLIEELELPLADAAAVLEEAPTVTAARLQSAWADVPGIDATVGPVPTGRLDHGPIIFDADLELDRDLLLDPGITPAYRPQPEATQPPIPPTEDTPTSTVSERVHDTALAPVDQSSADTVIEAEPLEPPIASDVVSTLSSADASQEVDASQQADEPLRADDHEAHDVADGYADAPVELDDQGTVSSDPIIDLLGQDDPDEHDAAPQAFDPYLALAPEYIEASSPSFPWNPRTDSQPVSVASLLALDEDEPDIAEPAVSEHEGTEITDAQATGLIPNAQDHARQVESEALAAALMAASARGDDLQYEDQVDQAPAPEAVVEAPATRDEDPADDTELFDAFSEAQYPPQVLLMREPEPKTATPNPVRTSDGSQLVGAVHDPGSPNRDGVSNENSSEDITADERDDTQQLPLDAILTQIHQTEHGAPSSTPPELDQQPGTPTPEALPAAASPTVKRFLSDLNVAWIAGGHDVLQVPASPVPLGGRFELADAPDPATTRKRPSTSGDHLTNDEAVTATYEEDIDEVGAAQMPVPAAVWIPGMADRAFRTTPWANSAHDDDTDHDLHGFGGISVSPRGITTTPSPTQTQLGDATAFMADGPSPAPEWDGLDEGTWAHADYGPKRPKANRFGQVAGLIAVALAAGVVYLFTTWPPFQNAIGSLGLPVDGWIIVAAVAGVLGFGGLSMFIGSSIPKRSKTKVVRRRRKRRDGEPHHDDAGIDDDDVVDDDDIPEVSFMEETDDNESTGNVSNDLG
ncbi:hypothetical protein [Stomatohabitans albus]|uniref:hypothetical protein n=1 Tax=Stomatohabitans albus TaxID=3110766 RepID=UPI00300DB2BB